MDGTKSTQTERSPLRRRRWRWAAALGLAALAFCGAFAIVAVALEDATITDLGAAVGGVAVVGAIVALPLFAIASLGASAIIGIVVAVFDRSFNFRRLAAVTACAIAAAVLSSAVGATALMLGSSGAATLPLVAVAHIGIALGYGWALERAADVRRRPAFIVSAALVLITTVTSVAGMLLG